MFSLLYFVTVYLLKPSITEAGLAEKSYTDGSLLQELERGYRKRFPIALNYNGLEGSPLSDLWTYIMCLNWIAQYVDSECPSEYRKPRCCYPDKCGVNLLEEFRIRKYKLCSETNYFPGVPHYVSPPTEAVAVNSKSGEGGKTRNTAETTENGVVDFTDHYGHLSSNDDIGKTVYHNDQPNVTAIERFVSDFDSDDYRKANGRANGEGKVQYLVTNLNGEDSDSLEGKSMLGPVGLRKDIRNAVKNE